LLEANSAQRRHQRLRVRGVATHHVSAVGQRGLRWMAGDCHHLLAGRYQQVHYLTPDVSRRSGNQDHSKLLSSVEGTLQLVNVTRLKVHLATAAAK
jgi:hypothetical protein